MQIQDKLELTESLSILCEELRKNTKIDPEDCIEYSVKRGLRNSDGTGVMAGLTNICNVEGYYIEDGKRCPREGKLYYRGIDMEEIIESCHAENRFGFEEVAYLLLFGDLPLANDLNHFKQVWANCRSLPEDFIEDMIMKAPSPNLMNKLARGVLALYSYDSNPDENSLENTLRQSIQLLAQLPTIMGYAYQVKRWNYDHKSMYIHHIVPKHSTAEGILNSIRPNKQFTDAEAKLLDLCLILHSEHGGGNNSTFATRVLTSSGTDAYSAIAAGIGSLKGPRHGGANLKVAEMIDDMVANIQDIGNEGQVADYLAKIVRKEAGDKTGLIYGMGHAVYTLSDPRAVVLHRKLKEHVVGTELEPEFRLLEMIERLTPEIFAKEKGSDKVISANVDLYSGLVYKHLGIPQDLYTPLFTIARMAGWCAHMIEEQLTGGRIIRPAYKCLSQPRKYLPMSERK